MGISAEATRKRLVRYYLALPFALLIALLFPYRSLLTNIGPWYLIPLWLVLGHLLPGLSYVITGCSFRSGWVLTRTSLQVYGRYSSATHLQAGFLVALAEEIVFRYALLFWLAEQLGSEAAGLLLTSLIFSAAHFRPGRGLRTLPRLVDMFIFALILGAVTLATRSFYPALLLHAVRNYILRCLLASREEYEAAKKRQEGDKENRPCPDVSPPTDGPPK